MTAEELMMLLEEMEPETEIRFASQPNWPFEYKIDDAIEVNGRLYLVEGRQIGYLPQEVKESIGW
jgi:hypothetical protein